MSIGKRFLKKTNAPIPYRKVVKLIGLYSIISFCAGAIAFKQYMDKKK
tara:strand:- start:540 stop:683 length:144 start_codon:yes stop_codon:yes gene_type:complete